MSNTYRTIGVAAVSLVKEKGSKFYGYAFGVEDTGEIKMRLDEVRAEHPKATHHCFAYRLGSGKDNWRVNDDGEPSGSAGKPILGQIDSFGLTNTLVIVARYFGGTKLGVPGLITAYKLSARATLEAADMVEKELLKKYILSCPYTEIGKAYLLIERHHLAILEQEISENVKIVLAIPDDCIGMLRQAIPYDSSIRLEES